MNKNSELIISYLTLREAIGFLGFSLPIVLWVGGWLGQSEVLPSISHYYHSPMRDIFVGYLFAISVFLMAYRGYESIDLWCGKVAGLAGIGVALFPTINGTEQCTGIAVTHQASLASTIHLASALVFFFTLAFFCLFLFTKGKAGVAPTPMKKWRNRVYRLCGVVILVNLALIIIYTLSSGGTCPRSSVLPAIFAFEALAIFAFGFSWIVKGEAILKDKA